MREMRQMRTQSELSEIADALRAAGSVALDLETYGPRKGDGLDPSLLYTLALGACGYETEFGCVSMPSSDATLR